MAMAPFIKKLVSSEIRGYIYQKRSTSAMGCRTKRATKSIGDFIKVMGAIKVFYKSIGLPSATSMSVLCSLPYECAIIADYASNLVEEELRNIFEKFYRCNLLSRTAQRRYKKAVSEKLYHPNRSRKRRIYTKLSGWSLFWHFWHIRRYFFGNTTNESFCVTVKKCIHDTRVAIGTCDDNRETIRHDIRYNI
jgi:hypothetical protein